MMAPNIVNLEDHIKKWAWQQHQIAVEKEHKNLGFKDLLFTIKWDHIKFKTDKPEYMDTHKLEKPESQIVFKSVFENRTAQMQEHQFMTERTTMSTSKTEITKGFTAGFGINLSLGVPYDVMSLTAGYGREISIQTTDEVEQGTSVTWSINSTVTVPPNHRTTAELVVKEQQFSAKFKMNAHIKGRVAVVVTNLKDNNSFLETIENDFVEIVREFAQDSSAHFEIKGKSVVWQVEGNCDFRFGIEQNVHLNEVLLETLDPSGTRSSV